jgi:hypothetical protein
MLEFDTFFADKIRRNAPPGIAPAPAALRDVIIVTIPK